MWCRGIDTLNVLWTKSATWSGEHIFILPPVKVRIRPTTSNHSQSLAPIRGLQIMASKVTSQRANGESTINVAVVSMKCRFLCERTTPFRLGIYLPNVY